MECEKRKFSDYSAFKSSTFFFFVIPFVFARVRDFNFPSPIPTNENSLIQWALCVEVTAGSLRQPGSTYSEKFHVATIRHVRSRVYNSRARPRSKVAKRARLVEQSSNRNLRFASGVIINIWRIGKCAQFFSQRRHREELFRDIIVGDRVRNWRSVTHTLPDATYVRIHPRQTARQSWYICGIALRSFGSQ